MPVGFPSGTSTSQIRGWCGECGVSVVGQDAASPPRDAVTCLCYCNLKQKRPLGCWVTRRKRKFTVCLPLLITVALLGERDCQNQGDAGQLQQKKFHRKPWIRLCSQFQASYLLLWSILHLSGSYTCLLLICPLRRNNGLCQTCKFQCKCNSCSQVIPQVLAWGWKHVQLPLRIIE